MSIAGLVERLKINQFTDPQFGKPIVIADYVHEPYTANLLRQRLRQIRFPVEAKDFTDALDSIKLIERRTSQIRKVARIRKHAITPMTKAEFDLRVRSLKAALKRVMMSRYKMLADRIKDMDSNQKIALMAMREASAPGTYWSNDIIGDSLDGVAEDLRPVLEKETVKGFRKAMGGIGMGLTVKFNLADRRAQEFIRRRFYDQGTLIDLTDNMRSRIADRIAAMYDQGFTIDDMVDELGSARAFASVEDYALERIARTETRIAQNEGMRAAGIDARDMGIDAVAVFMLNGEKDDVCADIAADNPYELDDPDAFQEPHPNCFIDPNTLIKTKWGQKRIVDIKVGDQVLTHKNRYRKVTALKHSLAPFAMACFSLATKAGTIKLTKGHRIFTVSVGWLEIERINIGHTVMAFQPVFNQKHFSHVFDSLVALKTKYLEIFFRMFSSNGQRNFVMNTDALCFSATGESASPMSGFHCFNSSRAISPIKGFFLPIVRINPKMFVSPFCAPSFLGGDSFFLRSILKVPMFFARLKSGFNAIVHALSSPFNKLYTIGIKEIKQFQIPAGTRLYNFEVEGDHSYVANNIAVHNCIDTWAVVPRAEVSDEGD